MSENNTRDLKKDAHHGLSVHRSLAHSYLLYLSAIILSFIFDSIYPINFTSSFLWIFGVLFILIGTVIAYWAQTSAKRGEGKRHGDGKDLTHEHFLVGPYSITRMPTHYGLFFMTLGLAFLYGSVWLIAMIVVAAFVSRLHFIPKQEYHLEQKYGAPYSEYKKKIKF